MSASSRSDSTIVVPGAKTSAFWTKGLSLELNKLLTYSIAIANSVGIFIENARDPKMVARLPDWYKRSFSDAQSFVLLPVMLENQSTVALMYGDWTHTTEPRRISQQEMAALNELSRELRRFFAQAPVGELETL